MDQRQPGARIRALKLRTACSQPILFAPWNQHELLAGFQYLMVDDRRRRALDGDQPRPRRPKRGEATLAGRAAGDNGARR